MINAKQEFLNATSGDKVIAADLSFGNWDDVRTFILYRNYTQEEYDKLLAFLDVEYDNGYGSQNLHGTIWCADEVWIERGEYDGSEWYVRLQYPKDFLPIDKNRDRVAKLKRIIK